MAAAPAIIGIAARFTGLGGFVSGLGSINAGMAGFATSATRTANTLQGATTNFHVFSAATADIKKSLGDVNTVFQAVLAPIRAVASGLGAIASTAISFSVKIVGVLAEIAGGFAALGVAAGIGVAAASAALVAGLGLSIAAAANFHQELTDLSAITGATSQDIGSIEEAVKRAATQFAISIPEIQRTALELVKAGVSAKDVGAGVLTAALAFQQLSKGELSAQAAGEGLGSLLILFDKQFRESGQSAAEFAAKIGAAVGAVALNTRASIQEVINGVTILGPTLTARGQTLETVFASINAVLASGVRGEVAGTGLRNLFNFLTNPSKDALKTIKEFGLEDISPFDVKGNIRPALDVLQSIATLFESGALEAKGLTPAEGEIALAEIFQTRAATIAALIRQSGPEQIAKFFEVFAQTNIIDQANKQLDSVNKQLELLRNNAELAAIAFGSNFIRALTDAAKAVNALFSDAEGGPGLLRSAASAAGGGLLSILTGGNQGDAGAAIKDAFGSGGEQIFGTIFNQVEGLRGPITGLVEQVGRLKDTFLEVVFPDGGISAINGIGAALQGAVGLASQFVTFLTGSLPTAAENFSTLQTEAGLFLSKLGDIVTQGRGFDTVQEVWVSLQPLIATSRDSLDGVATASAEFARVIVENRGPIIGALEAMVVVLTIIDLLLIGIVSNATKMFGFGATLAGSALANPGASGVAQNPALASSAQRLLSIGVPITPAPPISGQARDDSRSRFGLGSGALFGPTPEENDREIGPAILAEEQLADAIDGVTTALITSKGAVSTKEAADAAAARALDVVKRANDRLTESLEDADKAGGQAFRQLERTLAGVEQRWLDSMESIAEATEDAFDQITKAAQENRDDLNKAFEIREDEQERRDILNRRLEGEQRSFDQALEDRRSARGRSDEDELTEFSRLNEGRVNIFRQSEDRLNRERERGIEKDNVAFQRGQDDKLRIFSRFQEDVQRRVSQGFENSNTSTGREREDRRRREQLARDLVKSPDERAAIQERFKEETRGITERRQDEDQDLQTRRSQEESLLGLRRSQEQSLTKFRNDQDDVGTVRRNQQAEDEVGFRIQQEQRFTDFQRGLEDNTRDKRRLLEQRELFTRRQQDEEESIVQGRSQRNEQQALDRKFAVEGLDRQLARIDRDEQRRFSELLEQTTRRVAGTNRTAEREIKSAQLQLNDQTKAQQDKLRDDGTNIQRQARDAAAAIREADPESKFPKAQEALAQVEGINSAIARSQAVLGAGSIIAQQRGEGAITGLQTRLLGLQSTADGALSGLLQGLDELRSASETGQVMTITTVVNSPQVERLAVALERLAGLVEDVKPGTTIDTVNIPVNSPEEAGEAIESFLATVGGV